MSKQNEDNATENVASGNESVGAQVGRVLGGRRTSNTRRNTSGSSSTSTNTNIVSGNARVGCQADVINGNITITFGD